MTTRRTQSTSRVAAAIAFVILAGPAGAQTDEGWRFRGAIYGYFPGLEGSATLPTGAGASVDVDAGRLIDHLKAAFMGTIEAQRGRLGAFTDLMIYDVGGSRTGSGTLAISGLPLPPGVEARATLDVRATAWTLAASWRALDDDATTLDAFAGARMLDVRTQLGYELGADVGPFAGPARQGDSQTTARRWDAIGGVRGRARFGADRRAFASFYFDGGAGESKRTWQALAGLGYALGDAELLVGWRTLDYEMKAGAAVQDLTFSGPIAGFAYRW